MTHGFRIAAEGELNANRNYSGSLVAGLSYSVANATFVARVHRSAPTREIGQNIYTGAMLRVSSRWLILLVTASLLTIAGCRSPYVEMTVTNAGSTELHNIEVDYPNASFGISSLAPETQFHYKFKLMDAGRMKVEFWDNHRQQHSGKGPYATEGQRGSVTVTLDGTGKNVWTANLHPVVSAPKGR